MLSCHLFSFLYFTSVGRSENLLSILLLFFFNTDQGRLTGPPLKPTAYPPGIAWKKAYVYILLHNNALEKWFIVYCYVQEVLQITCKEKPVKIVYLWNWILCWCWCFIPHKIWQSPTFCYSIHPKAFIKLAFVRIVQFSISVLIAVSPGAFIPISICLYISWRVKL